MKNGAEMEQKKVADRGSGCNLMKTKERETGIEPATSRVERPLSFIAFRGLKGAIASLGSW